MTQQHKKSLHSVLANQHNAFTCTASVQCSCNKVKASKANLCFCCSFSYVVDGIEGNLKHGDEPACIPAGAFQLLVVQSTVLAENQSDHQAVLASQLLVCILVMHVMRSLVDVMSASLCKLRLIATCMFVCSLQQATLCVHLHHNLTASLARLA